MTKITTNDIELCSMALAKIGASPIASFDEPSIEAKTARLLYEPTLESLLRSHPWRFSLKTAAPLPAEIAPFMGYERSFKLPHDALRTVSGIDSSSRHCAYRVVAGLVLSDADLKHLTYQYRPDSAIFPQHFMQSLTIRLAAEFCLPITRSCSRADILQKLASVELRLARLIDSQQAEPIEVVA